MATMMYGIAPGSEAHIFGMLRGSLYSDKPLAVVRESTTNAWDAHQDAFIGNMPINVVLPTDLEPTFIVRDYGFGLSYEGICNTFVLYGASTKRGTNEQIGCKGIGSKAPFAYTDLFTIISYNQGVKSTYTAFLDETDVGQCNKVHEEPCGSETGLEIRVPVLPQDVAAFHRAAEYLFQFYTPTPNVNIPITPRAMDKRANGFLNPIGSPDSTPGSWIAVEGIVPYTLDYTKMLDELREAGLEEAVKAASGGLYFDIGTVSVSASREELEYTTRTKKAVVAKFKLLLDELIGDVKRTIKDTSLSTWERRVAVQQFSKSTQIPISARYAQWVKPSLVVYSHQPILNGDGNAMQDDKGNKITNAPKTFRLLGYDDTYDRNGHLTHRATKLSEMRTVDVRPNARIAVQDTKIAAQNFLLDRVADRVAVPHNNAKIEDIEAEIQSVLVKAGLEGIPVVRLTSLPTRTSVDKRRYGRSYGNEKHTERRFVLKNNVSARAALSDNWNIIDHEPGKDDVYVILSHFVPVGSGPAGTVFYEEVEQDRQALARFGEVPPPIYGIKTTQKHRVLETDVLGTPYAAWRKQKYQELLANHPEIERHIELVHWGTIADRYWYLANIKQAMPWMLAELGESHPIPTFFQNVLCGQDAHKSLSIPERNTAKLLCSIINPPNKAKDAEQHLQKRYPLFKVGAFAQDIGVGGDHTSTSKRAAWLEYFTLIDQVRP
jgi:hypothetical protein